MVRRNSIICSKPNPNHARDNLISTDLTAPCTQRLYVASTWTSEPEVNYLLVTKKNSSFYNAVQASVILCC